MVDRWVCVADEIYNNQNIVSTVTRRSWQLREINTLPKPIHTSLGHLSFLLVVYMY